VFQYLKTWRQPSARALISSPVRHSPIRGFIPRFVQPVHGTTRSEGVSTKLFGNFNYGATGTELGIPEPVLLRAAGVAQTFAKTTKPEFGSWWGGDPFGDDPRDQYWIKRGIEYAISQGY
jgi:hypothetical protein